MLLKMILPIMLAGSQIKSPILFELEFVPQTMNNYHYHTRLKEIHKQTTVQNNITLKETNEGIFTG